MFQTMAESALPESKVLVQNTAMFLTARAQKPNFSKCAIFGSLKVVRQPHMLVRAIKVAPIDLKSFQFDLDDGLGDRMAVVRLPFDSYPRINPGLQNLAQVQGGMVLYERSAALRLRGVGHRE